MSHRGKHSARVMGRATAHRAPWGLHGAAWLLMLGFGCADGDATPAYSYPFDPNAETLAPGNTVTNVAPNQPADTLDEANRGDDLNATGGATGYGGAGTAGAGIGAMGGVGGVGGSPGMGLAGDGGFYGFMPDDPRAADTAGFGGGGAGGTGGAAGGLP